MRRRAKGDRAVGPSLRSSALIKVEATSVASLFTSTAAAVRKNHITCRINCKDGFDKKRLRGAQF